MSSFVFWGPPGCGKSTLAASFTKLGLKVHFVDVDCKVATMANLSSLIKSKKVTYEEIDIPLDDRPLSEIARQKMAPFPKMLPQGYLAVCDIIDRLKAKPLPDAKRTVLVLDSATRITEHMNRLMRHHQKGPLEFKGWGAILANWEALADQFFKMQPKPYAHCVLTCHARDDKDEDLQRLWSKPLIDTQMREKIGSYVTEMYYLEGRAPTKTGKAKFTVLTKPSGRVTQARSSLDVPTTMDADMSIILKGKK